MYEDAKQTLLNDDKKVAKGSSTPRRIIQGFFLLALCGAIAILGHPEEDTLVVEIPVGDIEEIVDGNAYYNRIQAVFNQPQDQYAAALEQAKKENNNFQTSEGKVAAYHLFWAAESGHIGHTAVFIPATDSYPKGRYASFWPETGVDPGMIKKVEGEWKDYKGDVSGESKQVDVVIKNVITIAQADAMHKEMENQQSKGFRTVGHNCSKMVYDLLRAAGIDLMQSTKMSRLAMMIGRKTAQWRPSWIFIGLYGMNLDPESNWCRDYHRYDPNDKDDPEGSVFVEQCFLGVKIGRPGSPEMVEAMKKGCQNASPF